MKQYESINHLNNNLYRELEQIRLKNKFEADTDRSIKAIKKADIQKLVNDTGDFKETNYQKSMQNKLKNTEVNNIDLFLLHKKDTKLAPEKIKFNNEKTKDEYRNEVRGKETIADIELSYYSKINAQIAVLSPHKSKSIILSRNKNLFNENTYIERIKKLSLNKTSNDRNLNICVNEQEKEEFLPKILYGYSPTKTFFIGKAKFSLKNEMKSTRNEDNNKK